MRHASKLNLLALLGLALTTSCSTQAASRTDGFAGTWAYQKACADKHSLSIDLSQSSAGAVTGDWSEGTRVRGSDGKLSGSVRDGKLHVRYCSTDSEAGYAACPQMGDVEDYFVLRGGNLVRFQKYGKDFKEDVTLHPASAGMEIPLDNKSCENTEDYL